MIRAYELMVILDGELDDAGTEAGVKRIAGQIEAKGGTVKTTDRWGRRRFAYEINHKVEGYYVVFEMVGDMTDLDGFERQLRLADDVVRHKLIRLPEKEAAKRNLLDAPAPA